MALDRASREAAMEGAVGIAVGAGEMQEAADERAAADAVKK